MSPSPTSLKDPVLTLKEIIEDQFNVGNVSTLSSRPDVAPGGQWDSDHTRPQITITAPDEAPLRGGQTGYTGIDPTGGGPVAEKLWAGDVAVWASRRADDIDSDPNPKQVVYEVARELERLWIANADGQDDLESIGYFGPTQDTSKDDRDRTVWRMLFQMQCSITATP